MNKNLAGFSLLEIIIVLIIIGILATFVAPNIFKRSFVAIKNNFIAEFGSLVEQTALAAIYSSKVYKCVFEKDKTDNNWKLEIKIFNDKIDTTVFSDKFSNSEFEPLNFPENIKLVSCTIDSKEQMEANTFEVFFYINSDASAQRVKLKFLELREKEVQLFFNLEINPFFAKVVAV